MSIQLGPHHLASIQKHGEETFPDECCGFILGNAKNDDKTVLELLRADNTREGEEKRNRFLISPEKFMQTEKLAREKAMDIIGFYHSHPNAEARPSDYDRDHAWPWYSYIIVSVQEQGAQETTSWVLKEDRSGYDEETIVVTE